MSTANKIQLVSNRVELAKDLLLQQFKGKTNIEALLDVLVSRLQELENNLNEIQEVRTLEKAYGKWLDDIGEEAGVSRGDYNDNDYKTAIKIAYARRSSSASVDDILRIVMLLTNDQDVTISNPYPYYLELLGYLWCVKDSLDGLQSVAKLFPVNTAVRIIERDTNPFTLDTVGKGVGEGMLCNLIYVDYGDSTDPRFTTSETAILPPVVDVPVSNISPPFISGSSVLDGVLSLSVGVWDGDEPITYSYQWLRNGANIASATGTTYTIVNDDLGNNISAVVTATNTYGVQSVVSNSMYIENVLPPVFTVIDNLGFGSEDTLYSYTIITGATASSAVIIRFKSNGEMEYVTDGVTTSARYITGTDGNNYTLTYRTSNQPLVGMNINETRTISSDIVLSLTTESANSLIKTGTYTFEVRKIADLSDFESKTLRITAEVER